MIKPQSKTQSNPAPAQQSAAEIAKVATLAERKRIGDILESPEAARRPAAALKIAMMDVSATTAIAMLAAIPIEKDGNSAFAEAMARTGNPEVGASFGGDPNSDQAIIADVLAAAGIKPTGEN